jgi:hypothetical protein
MTTTVPQSGASNSRHPRRDQRDHGCQHSMKITIAARRHRSWAAASSGRSDRLPLSTSVNSPTSCQLPCPANRCACCRRIYFDPPGSKTGGPISGGPFLAKKPLILPPPGGWSLTHIRLLGREPLSMLLKKRGCTPLSRRSARHSVVAPYSIGPTGSATWPSINGVHKPWRVHTQHGWHRRKDGENTIRRRDHTQPPINGGECRTPARASKCHRGPS